MCVQILMLNAIKCISLFLLAGSMTAFADDNVRNYNLDSVAVTSSRVPLTLGKSARLITLMDSLAIAQAPVKSVNDLLKYVSGVDVRQRGALGAQTDVSIRGGSFDQIAVFLNGINICDPQTGHNSFDFPVDISEIDHIEVISGPAGVAYGSSSLMGAINIVTKEAKGNEATVHLSGGSYGLFDGGAHVAVKSGNVSNQLSANYLRSDGYSRNQAGKLNSDYSTVKAFYQGDYLHPSVRLNWHAGLSTKDFGSNTFYSAKYDDQFEHTLKTYVALKAETGGLIKFRPSVYWNRSEDRFELIRGNASKVPFNYHRTSVWGVNLNAYVETVIGKTAFGAEMRNEDLLSTNLGETLPEPKKIHSNADTTYVKGLNRTNLSIFLEHSVILRNFSVTAGVAAVRNTGNNDDFKFYPSVNASYRIGSDWKIYASYNSSLRMPTFTELYYKVDGYAADKNLKAERMQAVEGGVKYSRTGVNVTATVFYNMGRDMIDWIKDSADGEDAKWQSVNYTRLNTFGQEFSVNVNFPELLRREDFFLRNLNVSYSHLSQDIENKAGVTSMYTLEYLRHKLVARADFHIWNRLNLSASYRWQDRNGSYELYEKLTPSGKTVDYEPYSLLDARLSWDAVKYSVFAECNNLLNKEYHDFGNIPEPGFTFRIGTVVRFGWK